jgi:hypothetical protein
MPLYPCHYSVASLIDCINERPRPVRGKLLNNLHGIVCGKNGHFSVLAGYVAVDHASGFTDLKQ